MTTATLRINAHADLVAGKELWPDFLTARLDPQWRQTEWNPKTQIFTGDPNNPRTFIYLCTSAGCVNPTGVRNTVCPSCVHKTKPRSRTTTPQFHDSILTLCLVAADGRTCGRPKYSSTGLCFTHHSRFDQARRSRSASWVEFVAKAAPLEPLAACAVNDCSHQVLYQATMLCSRHHHQYRARTEIRGQRISQSEFAAQALPLIRAHEFTLAGCSPTVRAKLLWILQDRDHRGFGISILRIRNLLKAARSARSLFEVTAANEHVAKLLRASLPLLQAQRNLFTGVDANVSDRWGPDVLQQFPSIQGTRTRGIVIDWADVSCTWLRHLGKTWAIETLPAYEKLRPTLRALTWASKALENRQAFTDRCQAGRADIAAIVSYCRKQTTHAGGPFASDLCERRLWDVKGILAFCRSAGHMDDVPGAFVLTTDHLRGRPDRRRDDDDPGRALPDEIVDVLDRNMTRLQPAMSAAYRIQSWSNQDYGLMRQMIYQLLRDTGRRPTEITSLRRNCLEVDQSGSPVLIYNNFKANRLNRRLHITAATAALITTWTRRVDVLRPAATTAYLFPRLDIKEPQSEDHFKASAFTVIFHDWINSITELRSLTRTPGHPDGIVDRRDLVPYSLRHTYAQRHADAGTPVDVLSALLDHRNVAVTQGYYRIGPKRKREAIERVGALVMDRRGSLRPAPDQIEYERRSVSTLLGGCVEPSNVKSGGKSCPIRFQCGGCDHYRPDPSYIPEIEQEIGKIKADILEAQLCAAPPVVDNLRYNLAMFQNILTKMTANLQQLTPEERAGLDTAIGTIRRARELQRNPLPLHVIDHEVDD